MSREIISEGHVPSNVTSKGTLQETFVSNLVRSVPGDVLQACAGMTPLQKALLAKGMSKSELARQLETNRQNVGRWANGDVPLPREQAEKIAPILGVSLLELLEIALPGLDGQKNTVAFLDSGPNADLGDAVPLPNMGGPRNMPVKGIAVMGTDGDFSFNGEVVDYIPRPPALARKKNAFAIFAMNDSMEPAYLSGDPVAVDPDRPPAIGEDVVIELKPGPNGEAGPGFLKNLVRRNSTSVTVRQYNPPLELNFDMDDVLHIYRVVPRRELFGV